MKWSVKYNLAALLGFIALGMYSQDKRAFELGTSLHGVIAIGDIPLEKYSPKTSIAFIARYNFPYRLAIRGSFAPTYSYTDKTSTPVWEVYKSTRVGLGLEYYFNDFNIYDTRRQWTTYAMIGGTYQFGNFTGRNWNFISKDRLGLMGGFGAKFRAFPMLIVSAEVAAGYLLSDNYDRLSQFQNRFSTYYNMPGNDWYLFPNLTITYTFAPKF